MQTLHAPAARQLVLLPRCCGACIATPIHIHGHPRATGPFTPAAWYTQRRQQEKSALRREDTRAVCRIDWIGSAQRRRVCALGWQAASHEAAQACRAPCKLQRMKKLQHYLSSFCALAVRACVRYACAHLYRPPARAAVGPTGGFRGQRPVHQCWQGRRRPCGPLAPQQLPLRGAQWREPHTVHTYCCAHIACNQRRVIRWCTVSMRAACTNAAAAQSAEMATHHAHARAPPKPAVGEWADQAKAFGNKARRIAPDREVAAVLLLLLLPCVLERARQTCSPQVRDMYAGNAAKQQVLNGR